MSNREPYSGNAPYVFISYAHKNSDTVLPLIHALQEQDVRIWFDEGIEAGTEWPEYIAERLENSYCVIAFLSEAFTESQNCRREINFSIDLKKDIMAVCLQEVALSPGMRLQLSPVPALHRNHFRSENDLVKALLETETVIRCKLKPRMNLETDAVELSADECYENSLREKKSYRVEAAAEWVRVAALKGHEQARKQMGKLLKNSHYQPTGHAESARQWYILGDRLRVKSLLMEARAPEVAEFERMVGEQFLTPEDCSKLCEDYRNLSYFLMTYRDEDPNRYFRNTLYRYEHMIGEKIVSSARCLEIYNERKQDYAAQILEWSILQYQKDSSAHWLPIRIAEAYEKGEGTEPSIREAIKWYKIAADSGDHHAMIKLGLFYETGFGIEQDLTEAFNWYQQAADHSAWYLADCYANGIGVEKSRLNAMKWEMKGRKVTKTSNHYYTKIQRQQTLEKYSAK